LIVSPLGNAVCRQRDQPSNLHECPVYCNECPRITTNALAPAALARTSIATGSGAFVRGPQDRANQKGATGRRDEHKSQTKACGLLPRAISFLCRALAEHIPFRGGR